MLEPSTESIESKPSSRILCQASVGKEGLTESRRTTQTGRLGMKLKAITHTVMPMVAVRHISSEGKGLMRAPSTQDACERCHTHKEEEKEKRHPKTFLTPHERREVLIYVKDRMNDINRENAYHEFSKMFASMGVPMASEAEMITLIDKLPLGTTGKFQPADIFLFMEEWKRRCYHHLVGSGAEGEVSDSVTALSSDGGEHNSSESVLHTGTVLSTLREFELGIADATYLDWFTGSNTEDMRWWLGSFDADIRKAFIMLGARAIEEGEKGKEPKRKSSGDPSPSYILDLETFQRNSMMLKMPQDEVRAFCNKMKANNAPFIDLVDFSQLVHDHRMKQRKAGKKLSSPILTIKSDLIKRPISIVPSKSEGVDIGDSSLRLDGPPSSPTLHLPSAELSNTDFSQAPSRLTMDASGLMNRFKQMTSSPSFRKLVDRDSQELLCTPTSQNTLLSALEEFPTVEEEQKDTLTSSPRARESSPLKGKRLRRPIKLTRMRRTHPVPKFNFANPNPPGIPAPHQISHSALDRTFIDHESQEANVVTGSDETIGSPERHCSMYQMVRLFQRTPFLPVAQRPPMPRLGPPSPEKGCHRTSAIPSGPMPEAKRDPPVLSGSPGEGRGSLPTVLSLPSVHSHNYKALYAPQPPPTAVHGSRSRGLPKTTTLPRDRSSPMHTVVLPEHTLPERTVPWLDHYRQEMSMLQVTPCRIHHSPLETI